MKTEAVLAQAPVEVRPVSSPRERRVFINLPWQIYRGDPNWVPPLLSSIRKLLDPKRHPFHEHAEVRLYLAWRGGRPVGRIAAIVNRLHNSYHQDTTGFWGFFDVFPDAEACRALLDTAAGDLKARGMTVMAGPFSPSINSECGVLVEGFDKAPTVMMPYNLPYYPSLIEAAGLRPSKELYAYHLETERVLADAPRRQRLERIAAAVRRRHPDITVRCLDMKHYRADVIALGKLFDAARRRNWGYVPATDAELLAMAAEMKLIVEPELVLIAERRGEPLGCVIAIPDINLALGRINGRLLPFGWASLLWHKRRIRSLRVFGAACLPEHRNLGVIPLLFAELIANCTKLGYTEAELSWVAADNLAPVRTLESALHPVVAKRYLIYSREL